MRRRRKGIQDKWVLETLSRLKIRGEGQRGNPGNADTLLREAEEERRGKGWE